MLASDLSGILRRLSTACHNDHFKLQKRTLVLKALTAYRHHPGPCMLHADLLALELESQTEACVSLFLAPYDSFFKVLRSS